MTALSSAQVKLYPVVKNLVQGLDTKSTMKDIGDDDVEILLHCDICTDFSIVEWMGIGRTRHIILNEIWLQEKSFKE